MPRWIVLSSLGLVLAGFVVALEAVDRLRHPAAGGERPPAEADFDPRDEVVCPDPAAVEAPHPSLGPPPSAVPVSSNELYDCPSAWDGRTVTYAGEVVGAVLRRGEHAWVHLNDDVYAGARGPLPAHRDYQGGNAGVGVRIPRALAEEITRVGSGKARGDVLTVRGRFHRMHAASREPAVIVADEGTVTEPGRAFSDPLLPDRAIAAAALGVPALALVVAERLVARRRRR